MSQTSEGTKPSLTLPSVLDLTEADGLKKALQQALGTGDGLMVDASQVSRATSPCLQVLVAGRRAYAASGGPDLQIVEASDAFRDTATVLGLGPSLGL